jgi:hypothetical protein
MVVSFPLGETNPLGLNPLRAVSLDTALILVELVPVLLVVLLDDRDFLVGQTRKPADDLIVGAPVLEIGNQVVHCNPTGRELEPSATIDQSDLFLHSVSLHAHSARGFILTDSSGQVKDHPWIKKGTGEFGQT